LAFEIDSKKKEEKKKGKQQQQEIENRTYQDTEASARETVNSRGEER
jgi:hypothetical protein